MSSISVELEAVLFAAAQPLSAKQLAEATSQSMSNVKAGLAELKKQLAGRGITLLETHNQYSLATSAQAAASVKRYLGKQVRVELSQAALETLAIISYKQPITKSEIETIRGVGSDQIIKNLLMRDLIAEAGRGQAPGQPRQYVTTARFLQHLGLTKASDLPAIDQFNSGGHAA